MKITVIGTGYLGAVHAACLAELGHDVLGVDTDAERVAALARGRAPFYEPGLDEILARATRAGRLRFSDSAAAAGAFGEVHFICVGTPQLAGSQEADVSGVDAAVDALVPRLTRDCLVVGKSTVPVGTAARLAARVARLAPAGVGADLAWNPEFLREGHAVSDTLRPDRLVAGVASSAADAALREVYAPLLRAGVPYIATDLATAELVKLSANAFLATKISFINAVADVCDAAGADVVTLADAMGHDSRIGHGGLAAGLGFGGSCLSKDIRALAARSAELGAVSMDFLHRVDEINLRRRQQTVQAAAELAGGSLAGRGVAVLGAAFKPGTDDVRDSPPLAVADAMHRLGAEVRVHDPRASDNAREAFPHLDYAPEVEKACAGADLVAHLTDWREYREIDPAELGGIVRERHLLDGRNVLPLEEWRAAGWTARGIGRGHGRADPAPAAAGADETGETCG